MSQYGLWNVILDVCARPNLQKCDDHFECVYQRVNGYVIVDRCVNLTHMTGSVHKMHLLDSCFCRFKQIDRQKKRLECTFLGFHFPPTTFVYLLYRCAVIYFVAQQKKVQKSKNLIEK